MLGDKKDLALMIVIERMIAEYQREGGDNENIFKIFEDAKRIHASRNNTQFTTALDDAFPSIAPIRVQRSPPM